MMTTQTVAPRGTCGDQLRNWKLATRCFCCLPYIIMSSNQIVDHKKYNMQNMYLCNMYNAYMYIITIGIAQLKVFSCANNKYKQGTTNAPNKLIFWSQ